MAWPTLMYDEVAFKNMIGLEGWGTFKSFARDLQNKTIEKKVINYSSVAWLRTHTQCIAMYLDQSNHEEHKDIIDTDYFK